MSRHWNRYRPLCWVSCLVLILLIRTLGEAQQASSADLFAPDKMTSFNLKGLRVLLGQPVQVTAQLGYQVAGNWAFIHPTPTLAKFPKGELLVTYTLVPDTNENPLDISGSQISKDGGRTWGPRSTFVAEHQPMIYVPENDDSLMAIPAYVYPRGIGDEHSFLAAYTRFEHGGDRVIIEPAGVEVVDWPWPPVLFSSIVPRANWHTFLCFDGNALKVGGRLIATGYLEKKGESLSSSIVLASDDEGRIWRYLSTIAGPSMMPSSPKEGAEGPSETSIIQLADEELMAVFRVGSGKEWTLRRAYSSDGGRTWTAAEPIPPFSVEPSMVRIQNSTIALSTGRPGIHLWFSTDARGKSWQDIDIVEYHNHWAPDASYRIAPPTAAYPDWQTSAYTEMVEVAPNRLLLVYDRGAKPKPENSGDLTRIFVLPIEVERD